MKYKLFLAGAKSTVPICLGIIPIGISYGILALQAGLTQLETVIMSVLVMAGASQLMVLGMIGKATLLAMVTAVFFVNLRNFVMSSVVMSRIDQTSLGVKLLSTFALCDESFAVFSLSENRSAFYLLGANASLYSSWVLASVLGVVIGQFLPVVLTKSLGIAFYASFIALLVPNTQKYGRILQLILLAAAMNTMLQLFFANSWTGIISMVASAILGTFFVEVSDNESY